MAILSLVVVANISQLCVAFPSTGQLSIAAAPAPPLLWSFKSHQSINNGPPVAVANGTPNTLEVEPVHNPF